MPWDSFREGAFYAYDDDIAFLDETYDVVYETRTDDGGISWENIVVNDTHWESILDNLPLWIGSDTSVYAIEGYTLEVAPNHTRSYGDLTMMRAIVDDVADSLGISQLDDDVRGMLEDEVSDIDREMANMMIYMGEIKTVDRHTNGNMVEMSIMVQAVYDEDGLLMGAFLFGQYGDCIGCAGEPGGRFRVFDGLGWMVTLERAETNLPPAECRQVFLGGDDVLVREMPETTNLSAICPPVSDFHSSYEIIRQGVTVGWGGGQIVVIDDMPSNISDLDADIAFLDITLSEVILPAFTYSGDFPMGGEHGELTYHASNHSSAYGVTYTERTQINALGQLIEVLVYEGEGTNTITITSPIGAGTLNRAEQHRYYVDAQSGLIIQHETEAMYTSCDTICEGAMGDFYDSLIGQTRHRTMTLIDTNQPIGTCP